MFGQARGGGVHRERDRDCACERERSAVVGGTACLNGTSLLLLLACCIRRYSECTVHWQLRGRVLAQQTTILIAVQYRNPARACLFCESTLTKHYFVFYYKRKRLPPFTLLCPRRLHRLRAYAKTYKVT